MKSLLALLITGLLMAHITHADDGQVIDEVALAGTQAISLYNEQGEAYSILLSQPLSTIQPSQPIIIALDGNALFPVGLRHLHLKAFEERNHNGDGQVVMPVLIGVGYPNTVLLNSRRNTDYLPISDEHLQSFIADTVLSLQTQDNHKLKDNRHISLVGHSLGGLFALHAYASCATVCPYHHLYVASPSLWWRDGWVFGELDNWLSHQKNSPKISLSVGELEQSIHSRNTDERNAMLQQRNMVGNTQRLSHILNHHHIVHTLTIFEGSTHQMSAELALKKAIEEAFIE